MQRLVDVLSEDILVPNNVTNGNIVTALFPNAKVKYVRKLSGCNRYDVEGINFMETSHGKVPQTVSFYEEWWDAPFKAPSGTIES